MTELESRYRRLFAAYPPEYRNEHEEEMISTLLDVSRPDQFRPDSSEARAIVVGGLGYRFRSAHELHLGLRGAGVVALALVAMLSTAALGVVTLPPLDPSGWVQVVAWASVAVAACVGCRRSWGIFTVIAPTLTAALMVAGGSEIMGFRRSILLPAAAFVLLSPLAATASFRTRGFALLVGATTGGVLLLRFLDGASTGFAPDQVPWATVSRWVLAARFAELPAWLYVAVLAAALVGGVFRPRSAVAAAVLALPVALLTATRLRDVETYVVVVAALAVVVVAAVALARTALRPSLPADAT